MTDAVLVTGGFGLVGSQTVERLTADGRRVVVADLDTPANRKKAKELPDGVDVRWADLTDAAAVERLVSEVAPSVIVHLAAVIPPPLYRNPGLARKVNVDATVALVRAAEAQPNPPRFVQASSNAVYGSRNPHRVTDVVRAGHPAAAVRAVQQHEIRGRGIRPRLDLEWVVLRLGGCAQPELQRPAAQRRRHLHRERTAHRRADTHRRRARRRRRRSRPPRLRTSRARSC